MSASDVAMLMRPASGLTSMLSRTVQVNGKGIATIFEGRERTWSEFADRVARMASVLNALGVRAGDRVAVLGMTSDRFAELLAAIPRSGGIVVPLNWRWSEAELQDAIQDCTPTVIFIDRRMEDAGRRIAGALPSMPVVALDEGMSGLPFYEALLADHAPGDDAGRAGNDVFQFGYTGGTTGRSKAALITHRNVITEAVICFSEGFLRDDSVFLVNGPMFHAAGTWPTVSLMGSGGTAVLMSQLEPAEALKLIARHGVTESLLVPTVIQMLIEHPDFATTDTSSIRTVLYGAAPITETLLGRALEAFAGASLIQCYGMTELSPVCAVLHDRFLRGEGREKGRYRAAGRAMTGIQIRIIDEDDREVPRGEVGEIVVRSETMMLGYWKRPEETAEALRGGWMHTGDGGRMDEDGFIYIVDRVKDMIISGGENVYSTEVENALGSHPAVRQVVVIGIPDAKWGEAVHAIVRLHDGVSITHDDLITHTRALIASYKIPRSVSFWEGEFPMSPANKILKRELRRPYWEGRERTIV